MEIYKYPCLADLELADDFTDNSGEIDLLIGLGNWNSRKMEAGMENGNGNLQKSLLFIGFFTSEVHRTVNLATSTRS